MADSEYKIVVVGAGGVGKSALTIRFIQGNFVQRYDPTIEDSYRKQTEIDGQACVLSIMDTAGQEEYSSLRDSYMTTGEGFVIVYSITTTSSWESAVKLRTSILRLKEDLEEVPMILVGNKCDLEKDRQVTTDQAKTTAKKFGCSHTETSAKSNIHVHETFAKLVRAMNKCRDKYPANYVRKSDKRRGCNLL